MVAQRKEELDNPAFSDPIYAGAHQPLNIIVFEQWLNKDGEAETMRVEKVIEPNPASLIIDRCMRKEIER